VGIKMSEKAPTREAPDGHGAARYVWNLMSAMGIFFIGCGVTLYHGVHSLMAHLQNHGHSEAESGAMIALGILVFSLVVEGNCFRVALVEFNAQRGDRGWMQFLSESDDPTTIGILLEDAAAVFGVLIAILGVGLSAMGFTIFDPIASILIAILLGALATFLARSNARLLTGVYAGTKVEDELREMLSEDPIVESVNQLHTRTVGYQQVAVRVELELHGALLIDRMREAFDDDVKELKEGAEPSRVLAEVVDRTSRVVGREIDRIEKRICEVVPQAISVYIEIS